MTDLSNLKILAQGTVRGYFWNSIKMVVPAVLISTLLGALNGYVLTKWRFPGHKLVFGMMLLTSMISVHRLDRCTTLPGSAVWLQVRLLASLKVIQPLPVCARVRIILP